MAATPSGRVPPSGFGMFTRRDGFARYAPECTRSCKSASRPSSPSSYIRRVMPSVPAAASLFSSKNARRNASTVTWWRSAVRRSRGSRRTNRRIRSAACDALSRHCVRRALWLPGFPLGSVLGSIGSAGTLIPLFVDFAATSTESDFSMPFIFGYGFLLSSATPPTTAGWHGDLPGPGAARTCVHGFFRHRGIPPPPRHSGGTDVAFGQGKDLGIPDAVPFGAQ